MAADTVRGLATNSVGRELVITRVFDAPRALVWKVWTNPLHVAQWWGPHEFTNPVCELDVRPGGAIRIDMRGPDGVVYPMKGTFHEIAEPDRLVFTSSALEDENGNPQLEVFNTVTFAEQGGKTKLTLVARVIKATPEAAWALAGMEEGWKQSLDRLAEHLAMPGEGDEMTLQDHPTAEVTAREIVLTRVFYAPRELVFMAWTDARHVPQWWGPRGFTTTIHEMDVRPGGVWRFIMHGPDGTDYKSRIVFSEVVRPERLVYTHTGDEDVEPVRFQVTVTFAEQAGKTRLTMRMVFESAAELDKVVKEYGAVEGGKQTLDRLGEYLATM